jgi:hypothetical protein
MNQDPDMPTAHPLSRRHFLRAAGAAVALPAFASLGARAFAGDAPGHGPDGSPPLRQLIITIAGGTVIESWKPKAAGALAKLPSILRPLEACKSDLLILSGLSHNGRQEGGGNAHTHCAGVHLTGTEVFHWDGKVAKSTISVDQAAAKAVAGDTILPSLELGEPNGEQTFSWTETGTIVPYEKNPRQAFDRLFKGRRPTIPSWKRANGKAPAGKPAATTPAASDDRLVIDLVLEDAKAVRSRLGRGDQGRLDEYLESVHALEGRIVRLDQRAAAESADARPALSAGAHGGGLALPDDGPGWNLKWSGDDPEQRAEYFRLMTTLALLALQTDTTRVATLSFGNDGELWDGVVTVTNEFHHHTLEHQANAEPIEKADPLSREACRQIHEWYSVLFAELLGRMKGIDEAGSSLLDNTMLLYTSYMANGGHGTKDYPILLAGRAKGSLKPGRHVAYAKDTPVANLYLSMLDRMGANLQKFGESSGRLADLN